MPIRLLIYTVLFLHIAFPRAVSAAPSPSDAEASWGKRRGSSTDAARDVNRRLEPGVTFKARVKSYNQDGAKAIETLGEADLRKLGHVKRLELIKHFDAALPPLIQRANSGEAVKIPGSTAKRVWHAKQGVYNHCIFGPYAELEAGKYLLVIRMMSPKASKGRMATIDVPSRTVSRSSRNVETNELPVGKWRVFAVPFSFDKKVTRVEYRIWQHHKPLIIDRFYLYKVE